MTLRQHQSEFAKDVFKLLNFVFQRNIDVTFGEVYRTKQQQKWYLDSGYSKTLNSMHCKKLAIDINFFVRGTFIDELKNTESQLIERRQILTEIAKYWESLSPYNRAGYTWGWDDNHFERFVK